MRKEEEESDEEKVVVRTEALKGMESEVNPDQSCDSHQPQHFSPYFSLSLCRSSLSTTHTSITFLFSYFQALPHSIC
jgi:hypothetical protein